jgi:exonuclease SbcD
MSSAIRILFLADSHLGFDLPSNPRVPRRRRGHDFLANYAAALEPALAGEVDVVVHGGDVFDRPDVPEKLGWQVLRPLVRVAERGTPVLIVPGNHERAHIPHARLVEHRHVHVFDRPRTFVIDVRGTRVAFAGFPFERRNVRGRFKELVERSEWRQHDVALRLLCMHQCAEGASVGPGNFTFTTANDVVRVRDVPAEFAAVLSGHIHRHQVLSADLRGRPLDVPVLYPGSLERTSLAELGETKGYMVLHVTEEAAAADRARPGWEFRPLHTRPMLAEQLSVRGMSATKLDAAVRAIVAAAPVDAIVRLRIVGDVAPDHLRVLRAPYVYSYTPDTMNIEIRAADGSAFQRLRKRRNETRSMALPPNEPRPACNTGPQLDLGFMS